MATNADEFATTPATDAGRQRMRRGWLVRRVLLAADVFGLTLAFLAVEVFFRGTLLLDNVGIAVESAIFVALLPAWAVAAKLYGLYDRDEERATHSTSDEIGLDESTRAWRSVSSRSWSGSVTRHALPAGADGT